MAKLSLFCVAFLLAANCVQAWDPFGIFSSARKQIEEAGNELIGNAKAAFDQAMQNVFDNDITPLVNKVNAMALEDIDVLKEDIEEVVANATMEIEGLIDHAAEVAQKLIDKTIDEIKDKIIDETAAKVEEVTDHFFKGLDGFLQQLYQTVQKVNCMVQGDIDKVYADVYKLIGTGCRGLFPDKCCGTVGVRGKALTEMGDTQLYDLQICRRTSTISANTSVDQLEKAYADCQITAKKFYCIDFGTGSAKDFFTKQYNEWGTKYAFWAHPLSASQGGHRVASASARSQDCGTPVDCYQQAIQMLAEARQEIQEKADKTDLNAAKTELETEIMANRTELQKDVESAQVESTMCRDLTTGLKDDGHGAVGLGWSVLVFLDRHDVKCGANEQLTRWHVNSGGSGGNSEIEVQYTCCQAKITMQGADQAIFV